MGSHQPANGENMAGYSDNQRIPTLMLPVEESGLNQHRSVANVAWTPRSRKNLHRVLPSIGISYAPDQRLGVVRMVLALAGTLS